MTVSYPQKFTGSITWLYPTDSTYEQFPVPRAVLRSNDELVIDCDCGTAQARALYTVSLRRTVGDHFDGPWRAGYSTGKVAGRLYTANSGLLFRGTWHEDGQSEIVAELASVTHFPDEQPDI